MSRLIDADALIDDMVDYVVDGYAESRDDFEEYTKMVQTAPTIDAAEVVRGEWIDRGMRVPSSWVKKCSLCGYETDTWRWCNFCPNCGADMRGKGDE